MRHLGACLAVALVFAAVLWVGSAPSFGLVPELNHLEVEASFVYVEQNSDWYAAMFWRSDKADLATGPVGTGFGFSHSGLADATIGFQLDPPLVQRGGDLPVLGISCRSTVGARGTQAMGEGGASFGTIPTVYHTVYPLRPDYEAPGVLASDDVSTDWLRVEVGLRLTGSMGLYVYADHLGGWAVRPGAEELTFGLHPSLYYDAEVVVIPPDDPEEDPTSTVEVWLSTAGGAAERVHWFETDDPDPHYSLKAGVWGETTVFRRLTQTSVMAPRSDPLNYNELTPYLDIAQWRMESVYAMARPEDGTAGQLMIRPRLKRLYFAARHRGGDGPNLVGVDFQQFVRLASWHFPGSADYETRTLPGLGWEDDDGRGNTSQLDPSGLSRWELSGDIIMVTQSRLQPAGGFWFVQTQEVYLP